MFTEKDYPKLRKDFIENFMKGTYKRRSYHENPKARNPWPAFWGSQPKVRGRYLAEGNYGGKYQPRSFHESNGSPYRPDFMVIGRYFTKNYGFEHYRIKALYLSGPRKGKLGFISIG